MKSIDVKSDSYAEYNVDSNTKDPKFKIGVPFRISKYKHIFSRGYTSNCSDEIFEIKKFKNTVPWTYVQMDLNGKEIAGTFYEKELQKAIEQKKQLKEKETRNYREQKLYVTWKGYDNLFNSWIDKKDIV